MSSWRERLCGSQAIGPQDPNEEPLTMEQVHQSNDSLSHGGGFLGTDNPAHLKTSTQVILPTDSYAVLILKRDGNAVIYSEDEAIAGPAEEHVEEGPEPFAFTFKN